MSDYILKVTTRTMKTSEFRVIIYDADSFEDAGKRLKQDMLDGLIKSKKIYEGENYDDIKVELEYDGEVSKSLEKFILDKEEVV